MRWFLFALVLGTLATWTLAILQARAEKRERDLRIADGEDDPIEP